ncbi:TPA: hypothetical protein DEB00_04115 [Candidatus Uhrbacteria bacterium]|nr:hypothetical protein [Candidatus Uhrbacteria bacterium]
MTKQSIKNLSANRWLTWMPAIGLVIVTLAMLGFFLALLSSAQQIGMYVDASLRPEPTLLFVIFSWLFISLGATGLVLWIVGTFVGWPLTLIYRRATWPVWLGYGVVILGFVGMIGFQFWARSFTTEEVVSNRALTAFVRDGRQFAAMVVVFGSIVFSFILNAVHTSNKENAR